MAEEKSDGQNMQLNTGAKMPRVGFGTFLSKKGEVAAAVGHALKNGYRHIDCAATYGNECEIGEVFAGVFGDESSGIKREDVFVTSKLWITCLHPNKVEDACRQTLKDLQLDYVDLYLVHMPVPIVKEDGSSKAMKRAGFTMHDTWKAMEAVHKLGLAKAIGISNFPAILVNDLQNGCEIMPAVHQIERHPYLQQNQNVVFNKSHGIVVTAYAPLGAPGLMASKYVDVKGLLANAVVLEIAKKHGKTAAQVLIRWSVDSDVVVIPKSVTPARIEQNFDVFDFALDEQDMKEMLGLDIGMRTFAQDWMGVPMFQ